MQSSVRSAQPAGAMRHHRRLLRHWQLIALICWTALWFLILAPGGGIAWHFFAAGSRLLFSGPYGRHYHAAGGLHLYANYPWLAGRAAGSLARPE